MRQRTLLLIDDDKFWSGMTAGFFKRNNYRVVTAATCADGLRLAAETRPDCVLLDFHLPDADGCSGAFAIRNDGNLKKTPVIMASCDGTKELTACRDYKVDGFFLKPGRYERLLDMVDGLLRRVEWERGILTHKDIRLDGTSFTVSRDARLVAKLTKEQFRLLFGLVERTPDIVSNLEIARNVFGPETVEEREDAIRGLAHRLRVNLGARLGHRIKSRAGEGWGYLHPADKKRQQRK
ncbi:MAG: response regulator transcription factor [Elusimicrobia bacterium]|nr:response regulator transcription factor [Elusimicrobiota bacterium]